MVGCRGGGGMRKFALGQFGEENIPQIGENARLGILTLYYASIKGF